MPIAQPQNAFSPNMQAAGQQQPVDMGLFNIPNGETPQQAAERKRRAVAHALSGGMPQDVGQGIASIGNAIAMHEQQRNAAFPTAPGGQDPNFLTAMKNLFSGGNNGGLY